MRLLKFMLNRFLKLSTMWHKMTLAGKILLFIAGFGFGLAIGYKTGKSEANSGNNVKVEVNGKVKDGSDVNINLDNQQSQEKDERTSKKILGLF